MTEVVFTNGCFDILHRGHIELLKYSSSLGRVVVGLNSDASVKSLKGSSRPFNSEADRKAVLESIRYVSEVVIFNEETPLRLIELIQPRYIVKGGDYLPENVVGYDICEVKIFNTIPGYSSTKAIDSIELQSSRETESC
jgi:D-beta-D-heptose 7-phosphate kinase/D-beta-D-heptose 1-phosphate adenosyltransferase